MRSYLMPGLALAIVVGAIAPVFAQDADVVFTALDKDKNGSVSQAEAQPNAIVRENFAAADSNMDGMLSHDEFLAAFGKA